MKQLDDNDLLQRGQLAQDPASNTKSFHPNADGTTNAELLTPKSTKDYQYLPFPIVSLPQPLCDFVREGSLAIGCDPSYVALPALACLAACIGNARAIMLKRTWLEYPIVWTATVGSSGTLKSPALELSLKYLREIDENRYQRHLELEVAHEEDLLRYEAKLRDWKNNPEGDLPHKPCGLELERLLCSDTTVEAIASMLSHSPRGLLLYRDELSGWLCSFDAYKRSQGSDVAHWLEFHRGGSIHIDRKSGPRAGHRINRASVSIAGTIQLQVLERCLGKEHFENGLAPRLLLAMPNRVSKRWTETELTSTTDQRMSNLFHHLSMLEFAEKDHSKPTPVVRGLTNSGKEVWVDFYNTHAEETTSLPDKTGAVWSKLEGYAARLALVIHEIRIAAGDPTIETKNSIDANSIRQSVELVKWFGHESRRIYEILAEDTDTREHQNLVDWIRQRGGRVTATETMTLRKYRESSKHAESALQALVENGLGHWESREPTSRGGRPTREFVLIGKQ